MKYIHVFESWQQWFFCLADILIFYYMQLTLYVKDNLTVAAMVARATHAVSMAAPLPLATGLAAGVGGAFGGGVAVAPLTALQVAHALVELKREREKFNFLLIYETNFTIFT